MSRSRVVLESLAQLSSRGVMLAAGFAQFLYLTRSLGPAGYGLYSVTSALSQLAFLVIDPATSSGLVPMIAGHAQGRQFARTCMRLALGLGLLVTLASWIFAPAIAWLLHTHGPAVIADQELRARDEGETPLTNPNIHIRRRLRKLYEDYKPEHRCVRPCRLSPPPVVGQQSESRVPGCGRGISSAPWLL